MLNNLKALNVKYKQDNLKSLLEAEIKRQYEYEVNSRIVNCNPSKLEAMILELEPKINEPLPSIPALIEPVIKIDEPALIEPVTIQSESSVSVIEEAPIVKHKGKHRRR